MIVTEIMSRTEDHYGEELMAQTSNEMRIAPENGRTKMMVWEGQGSSGSGRMPCFSGCAACLKK